MMVTDKGQVTIPKALREELGILPGTDVDLVRDGDAVLIRRSRSRATRGQRLVDGLRGRGDVAMSTDEIMALTRAG